jgi:hypothetical protein
MRWIGLALVALIAASSACSSSDATEPAGSEADGSAAVLAHLVITGDPTATNGATWTYRDTVDGIVYSE